jgi:hypothetical protein
MTYQQDTNPGPARSTVGNVNFFFAVVALIIAIAPLGFFGERTAPQPEPTTVGQSRPPPAAN